LRNNNTLTSLNIGCNDISEKEEKLVRDTLRENHILTELII